MPKIIKKIPGLIKNAFIILITILGFISILYLYVVTKSKFFIYAFFAYFTIVLLSVFKFTKKEYRNLIITSVIALMLFIALVYVSYFAKYLNKMTGVAIDTWMNFLGALSGSVITILGAYIVSGIQAEKDKREKDEYAKSIIASFISEEIDSNFRVLDANFNTAYHDDNVIVTLEDYLKSNREYGYYFDKTQIKVEEFNKIKYDLVKYNNDDVKHVIKLYELFNLLREKDLEEMNDGQFDRLKDTYHIYKEIKGDTWSS